MRNADFYPASAFRDNSAAVQYAVAFLALNQKINAGASVQLAYDNPLGAVDDKLAAADHHGYLAQVYRLLSYVLPVLVAKPAGYLQGIPVCQTQLPTLAYAVPGLLKLVKKILQYCTFVVAFYRKGFAKQLFQSPARTLRRGDVSLQKLVVALPLYDHKVRDCNLLYHFAEITNFQFSHFSVPN